jgi:hypothetical protein
MNKAESIAATAEPILQIIYLQISHTVLLYIALQFNIETAQYLLRFKRKKTHTHSVPITRIQYGITATREAKHLHEMQPTDKFCDGECHQDFYRTSALESDAVQPQVQLTGLGVL